MQFLEKQFHPSDGFVLVPTGIESLMELIQTRVDRSIAFVIYHGDDISRIDAPMVGHAGVFRGELLAPILSHPDESYAHDENGRKVYMLDPTSDPLGIIQVPTGIPLVGMRDSYRYQFAMQVFYTRQSIEQILESLRDEGGVEFLYARNNAGPMDFTPVSELQKNLKRL